jgi:two-component system, OmpR family, sensor histidine kinase CpxA
VNRLFLKVFLWFWATVIILGISLVLSFVLGPKGTFMPWQNTQWLARRVVGAMDARGIPGANDLLGGLEKSEMLDACLFDESGKPIAGNHCGPLQSLVRKPVPGAPLESMGAMNGMPPMGRMDSSKDWSVYRSLMTERSRSGQLYYLASQMYYGPKDAHRTIFGLLSHLGLLLLVSSVICYLLTRQLTRPILRLREASTQIAEGKLEARVDATVERRGDEFGDLGRDFNSMAARIQDLLSSQRQLISDVSHEVRSPLARMNLAVDLARRRLGNDPAFDRLTIDLDKLNEMIGRLLTIAKLESGAAPMEQNAVDLCRVAGEIVDDAQMEARARQCTIAFQCDGQPSVTGNENLLRSAIENVVRNAVYYTHPGTEILIELKPPADPADKMIALSVSDHGSGVPAEDLEKIFKPFYRVAEARDRQSGGAGLGLAIASRVITMHRGRITARNREGGGLEVKIELPEPSF